MIECKQNSEDIVGGSGGGGSGSYFSAHDIEVLRVEARRRLQQSRVDAEINSYLQKQLARVNDRDVDKTNESIDRIEAALRGQTDDVERLLFGGSVAKHTYVDGLSDVDLLVVMKEGSLTSKSTAEVLEQVRSALLRELPQGEIKGIRTGRMAVTIEYRDGTEIQLLPAAHAGENLAIAAEDGRSWTQIRPREFASRLTEVNKSQGAAVVPAIKLAKAIVANLMGDSAPSGYHLESLALLAFRDYTGSRTPKSMVTRFFEGAATDVLRSIADVTGQSVHVDAALGPEGSPARRELARTFRNIATRLSSSSTTSEWRALLD
jgi:hypothetical protein